MKNILLASLMVLGISCNASASGLYFGIGYSNSDPDMSVNTLTGNSNDTGEGGVYDGLSSIGGWPGGNNSNSEGYWTKPWSAGLPEEWKYYSEKNKTYSFSVGWAIPQNPFRFEFEFLKTSFKVKDWDMIIYPGSDGALCTNNSCDDTTIPTNKYVFDLTTEFDDEVRDVKANSYMFNVLFEIPGFGNIDPYIGFGYGFTKIDTEQGGVKGGTSNEPTQQYIVGVEYRVPDSPLIVGLEYKKLKMDEGDERDDKFTSIEYNQDIIMLKLRYDFISDII